MNSVPTPDDARPDDARPDETQLVAPCPRSVPEDARTGAVAGAGTWSRRQLLSGARALGAGALVGAGAGTLATGVAPQWASAAVAGPAAPAAVRPLLVVVFLRGGADGLSLVPPVSEPAYYTARPNIAVPQAAALALAGPGADTRFALHPAARRISAMFDAGRGAVVVGTGVPTGVRSHFADQASVEGAGAGPLTGWAGRFLAATAAAGDDPLRAVSVSGSVPASLRGYPAVASSEAGGFTLARWGPSADKVTALVSATYRRPGAHPLLAASVPAALASATRVPAGASLAVPATWPAAPWAKPFWPVARLAQLGVGVQVANVDVGGWDTHTAMGAATNDKARMHSLVAGLDAGIGAFFDALPAAQAAVTTMVVLTEFGRRLAENSSGGVDHGRSFPMLVLGAGVRPGVYGAWGGLDSGLDGGDVAVRCDYGYVLAELLHRRLGATAAQLSAAFPALVRPTSNFLGVCT